MPEFFQTGEPDSDGVETNSNVCSAPELKQLIEKLAEQITTADQNNAEALKTIQSQLTALSDQSRSARTQIPPRFAGAFDRLDDAIADLARRVSGADQAELQAAGIAAQRPSPELASLGSSTSDAASNAYADESGAPSADTLARSPSFRPALADAVSDDAKVIPQELSAAGQVKQTADLAAPADALKSDPDMPWSEDSAEALTRIYESGAKSAPELRPVIDAPEVEPPAPVAAVAQTPAVVAPAPQQALKSEAASVPAIDFDKPWLEQRFSDIASQLTETLATDHIEISFSEISRRLEALETRFEEALTDVAMRADVEGLQAIEHSITDLSNQFEQSREELGRVAMIEQEVLNLADRLSEDRIAAFTATPTYEAPAVDFEGIAQHVAAHLASTMPAPEAQPEPNMAPLTDDVGEMKRLLDGLASNQREEGEETNSMLNTMQEAMIRLLDRMDAMETAQLSLVDHVQTAVMAMPGDGPADASAVAQPKRPAAPTGGSDVFANNKQDLESAPAALAPTASTPAANQGAAEGGADQDDDNDTGSDRRAEFIKAARKAAAQTTANATSGNRRQMRAATVRASKISEPSFETSPNIQAFDDADDDDASLQAPAQSGGSRQRLWVAGLIFTVLAAGGGLALSSLGSGNSQVARTLVTPETRAAEQKAAAEASAASSGNASGQNKDTAAVGGASGQVSDIVTATTTPGGLPHGIAVDDQGTPMTPQQLAKIEARREKAQLSSELSQQIPSVGPAPASLIPTEPTLVAPGGQSATSLADRPPALIGPASLRTAAVNGTPSAQFEIGSRFAEGSGVPQDFDKAATWYEKAAKQNFALAQYRLATLHERGLGRPTDKQTARVWYRKAADQGTVKAMHNLAVLTAGQTRDGKPDYVNAAIWFKRAAEHGLADSQFNLAILYQNGLGVRKDMTAAYKWFALAARGGDKEASVQEKALGKLIGATAKTATDLEVATWRPKPFDQLANDPQFAGRLWQTEGSSS